jgi:uncharacterized protein (TIRG00374 family)
VARLARENLRCKHSLEKRIALCVAVTASVVGAAAAIYGNWATTRQGLAELAHTRAGWAAAGAGAELASMAAFGQLQRVLLRAAGVRLPLRKVLATIYTGNAIAVWIPVVGPSIATAYNFRGFRRSGAEAGQAWAALTVAGIFATAAFAILAAAAVAATGNPALAALTLSASQAVTAVVVGLLMRLHKARLRARLVTLVGRVVGVARHATRGRPHRDLTALADAALAQAGALRLDGRTTATAAGYALAKWAADVCCLICALYALHVPAPWAAILGIWSAGAGAYSLSPTPAGIGVVDIALIAAQTAAGIAAPTAVAVTVLYRLLSFKILASMIWFGYQRWQFRARARAAARGSGVGPTLHANRNRRPA